MRLGHERNELNVVSDQYGTPTWARDLAASILKIISEIERGNDKPGVYHYSNEGAISWFEFAKKIMELAKIHCHVNPIETKDYPTKADRPKYSVLDKSKIKSAFDVNIPNWKDSLENYLR